MFGGFGFLTSRPVLAGVLFELLTYKPQLGLLIPVALVAGREWRCLGSALVTTIVLAAAVTIAFGSAIWSAWLHMLPAYQRLFDSLMLGRRDMPTVMANLQIIGAGVTAARSVQLFATFGAVVLVWLTWSRGSRQKAIAAMPPLTLLATPHAFVYDCPILAFSLLLFLDDAANTRRRVSLMALGVCLAAILLPGAMVCGSVKLPLSPPILVALVVTILLDGGLRNALADQQLQVPTKPNY